MEKKKRKPANVGRTFKGDAGSLQTLEQSFIDPTILTLFELRFCEEFVNDFNATQAILRAGFKGEVTSAGVQASRMLKKANVREKIKTLRAQQSLRASITADMVVLGLKEVAERCMQKAPVMDYDPDFRTVVQKSDDQGRDVWEFDSAGANKAFELLGKHLGVFEKDNLQKRVVFNVALVKNTNHNDNG